MFQGRPSFARMVSVVTVTASCLAAAACGSSASSGTARPSSTADPLASMTAAKIQQQAIANAEAASSLTMDGIVTQSGQTYTIDLGIKHSQGCAGTVGVGAQRSRAALMTARRRDAR